MKRLTSAGFTIIEVMLFLAVSGALAAAILAGSGATISQQRYVDAANRMQAMLQAQYSQTADTINTRLNTTRCDPANATVGDGPGDGVRDDRGASDCVVLGRYVGIEGDGKTIVTSSVIGYQTVTTPEPTDDLQAFAQYKIARSSVDTDTQTVPWGAKIVKPGSNAVRSVSIFVLRSPLSGSLRTFISDDYLPSESVFTVPSAVTSALNTKDVLCLSPSGFTIGERLGVVIDASASGPSAIERLGQGSNC